MKRFVELPDIEKSRELLDVVGRFEDMSIASDEFGELYFVKCEENEVPPGTVVEVSAGHSIEELPEDIKEQIKAFFLEV